jgi:O-succinylbenzoate synthase
MTSLRVDRLVLREIRLPLRERFEISSGWVEERRILLLELHHPDGPVAWAECVAGERPNYSPETIDTAWLAIREWLGPKVLAHTFPGPDALAGTLADGIRGHPMAKAAVEMGFWCMAAELEQVSLARRLGGTLERVPVGISLGIQGSPGDLATKASEAVVQGYRKVKLKIRPGADHDYVAAAREAVGPEHGLAVDANAAYTLADTEELRRLDDFHLMMIEQPLATGDLVRHAELQARLQTPICLDESIVHVASAEDMIALGSGRIINVKPGRVGGLLAARAIHGVAEAHGMPVWCGGMLESGIGRAYNVALASLRNFTLPGDLSPSRRYWERDIVEPEWTMTGDGFVVVPFDVPGLGVDVNVDRIDDLTVRTEELAPRGSSDSPAPSP